MRYRTGKGIFVTLTALCGCSCLSLPGLYAQTPAQTNDPGLVVDKYSSIASLTVAEKFNYRVIQAFGPRGIFDSAFGAAVAQARNIPHEWGGGAVGYADRFGSSFGSHLGGQTMEFVLESALHEDPRYFPSSKRGAGPRIGHALLGTVMTRTDSGGTRIASARIASTFAAGQLVNAWQPPSESSAGDGLSRAGWMFAEHAAWNIAQEFIPRLRPKSLRQ
jgi:hypothetical protein